MIRKLHKITKITNTVKIPRIQGNNMGKMSTLLIPRLLNSEGVLVLVC